jgi:hypothetical protein
LYQFDQTTAPGDPSGLAWPHGWDLSIPYPDNYVYGLFNFFLQVPDDITCPPGLYLLNGNNDTYTATISKP